MAGNTKYIYALIEYVENTAGFVYKVYDDYEEAKKSKEKIETWQKLYEPKRKVQYIIQIYKKGG